MERGAISDLINLRLYLEDKVGVDTSARYIDRVEVFCQSFNILPHRGGPRDDSRIGLRIAVFERRVTIAYRIGERTVTILRVLGAGQDVAAELGN